MNLVTHPYNWGMPTGTLADPTSQSTLTHCITGMWGHEVSDPYQCRSCILGHSSLQLAADLYSQGTLPSSWPQSACTSSSLPSPLLPLIFPTLLHSTPTLTFRKDQNGIIVGIPHMFLQTAESVGGKETDHHNTP